MGQRQLCDSLLKEIIKMNQNNKNNDTHWFAIHAFDKMLVYRNKNEILTKKIKDLTNAFTDLMLKHAELKANYESIVNTNFKGSDPYED